jgi:hypothetical protein
VVASGQSADLKADLLAPAASHRFLIAKLTVDACGQWQGCGCLLLECSESLNDEKSGGKIPTN